MTVLGVFHKRRLQKYLFSYPNPFCLHVVCKWLPHLLLQHPNLALDTALWSGSVIASALKVHCSLTSSSQHAAQSKNEINRKFIKQAHPESQTYVVPTNIIFCGINCTI